MKSVPIFAAVLVITALFIVGYYVNDRMNQRASILSDLEPAAGTTGRASATVVEPLHITGQTALQFGIIESATSGGEVIVTPLKQRLVSGGVVVSNDVGFDPAQFNIRGKPNSDYTINLPSTLVFHKKGTASLPGVTALTVKDFKSYSETATRETQRGRINNKGQDIVYVGGTLIVPSTVSPGNYSGEVPITVSY